MQLTKSLDDGIVTKLVFEDDNRIAETVVYNYACRSVICFSVQSGCPVGCKFCGTGKRFIGNLHSSEIELQIEHGLALCNNKPQLMAMSMGEPMLNWDNLILVVENRLQRGFSVFISTVGVASQAKTVLPEFLRLGMTYPTFGLQWSLHHHNEEQRQKLLGNYPLLPMDKMLAFLQLWTKLSGRRAYCNYICTGEETVQDAVEVGKLTSGLHLTLSVLSPLELGRPSNPQAAERFRELVYYSHENPPEMSLFDPAGQDTIGGGCGQLLYIQDRLNQKG